MTAPRSRMFWCAECGTEQAAEMTPVGWWIVNQAAPLDQRHRYHRRGVYCSAACLSLAAPRLDAQERNRQSVQAHAPSPGELPGLYLASSGGDQ